MALSDGSGPGMTTWVTRKRALRGPGHWTGRGLPYYPCPNGSTGPSWQWTRDLNDLSGYYVKEDDGGSHLHDLLSYINKTQRRGKEEGRPASARARAYINSILKDARCRYGRME